MRSTSSAARGDLDVVEPAGASRQRPFVELGLRRALLEAG